MQIELFRYSWLIGKWVAKGQVWIERWIAVMFWILNQSVHRINCPCIYYVHSSETHIANGNDNFLITVHACVHAHVHTVWERSSGLAMVLCHRCFGEECTYPHVTITEDLLNSMDTNLQSVIVLEFYPVLVYAFTGPPLGLLGELWTLNFELLTEYIMVGLARA